MEQQEENQFINGLWFLVGGGWCIALLYGVFIVFISLTVVGWPFVLDLAKTARFVASPYGKSAILRSSAFTQGWFSQCWKYTFGTLVALLHIGLGVVLVLSIVGFPFGVKHFQLVRFAVAPFYVTIRMA